MNKCFVFLLFISYSFTIIEARYVGGYYFAAAQTNKTKISDINANLLTHLYYAFLDVNEDGSFTIQSESKGLVEELTSLKKFNPDLKLMFSCVNKEGSFSIVAADEKLRKNFVQNAYDIISKNNYDGLDLDWEFPTAKDKENFTSLIKELKTEFAKHGYLLSAALRANPGAGYDVPEISKYLDRMNIMTYDYFGGSFSATTGLNAPLYPSAKDSNFERNNLCVNASMHNWVNAGAPKSKLTMGIPFYGRTFNLTDPAQHGIHAPNSGAGTPKTPTYYMILRDFKNYTTEWTEEQKGVYKYSGSTWLSYDNEKSLKYKAEYAKENNISGLFVWHILGDDILGEFSERKQPLLQAINDNI